MSYVVQNTFNERSLVQFTPRIKLSFFFKNTQIFYFFLSQNFFNRFFKKFLLTTNQFKYFFMDFFFFNQIFRIFKKINLNLLSFHDNKLTKSYIFWFYSILINNLKNIYFTNSNFTFSDSFIFNSYLLPIKFFNTNLSSLLFKNIFFNLLFINSFFFFNNNPALNYLKNSLNLFSDISIYPFYNGYFFNVYSL